MLYPALCALMQTLGHRRLRYGTLIDTAFANGEATFAHQGIRRNALAQGLAEQRIVSFDLGPSPSAPDGQHTHAHVNHARHGMGHTSVHLPLALSHLNEHGQAADELGRNVLAQLEALVRLAQPEYGWQLISPSFFSGVNHATGACAVLPNERGCTSRYWQTQPFSQPRMLYAENWLSPDLLNALPDPALACPAANTAADAAVAGSLSLQQRLVTLLGPEALQEATPLLTRVTVPPDAMRALNDTLGREGRLACWLAPRVRKPLD